MKTTKAALATKERLRKRYRPGCVRLLFVGESPPASGRFFYQADSGLYRAIRDTFALALPNYVSPGIEENDFLVSFGALGCYLIDLCGEPVDRLSPRERKIVCADSEVRLARTLRRLRPDVVITVVRSIGDNVKRSERHANWCGRHIELPYPGRWHHYRRIFVRELALVLRETYRPRLATSISMPKLRKVS